MCQLAVLPHCKGPEFEPDWDFSVSKLTHGGFPPSTLVFSEINRYACELLTALTASFQSCRRLTAPMCCFQPNHWVGPGVVVACVVVCHLIFFDTTTGVPKKVGYFQILHVLKVPSGPFDHQLFFSVLCFVFSHLSIVHCPTDWLTASQQT